MAIELLFKEKYYEINTFVKSKCIMDDFLREAIVAESFQYTEEIDNDDNYIDPAICGEYIENNTGKKKISFEDASAHKLLYLKNNYLPKLMEKKTVKNQEYEYSLLYLKDGFIEEYL